MTLIDYKIIAALMIFIIGLTMAIYPIRRKQVHPHSESVEIGEALASGIFLGAALFHLLPDAIKQFGMLYPTLSYPLPEVICVAGFLLLLLLERTSLGSVASQSKNTIPYILTLTLIIHAVTEGAALGIGTTLSETFMLLIAIIAHKGSESYALCVMLLRHELPFRRVLLLVITFSLMTPFGISMGAMVQHLAAAREGEILSAYFNAFAAGTFLYISTLHHIHFHKHAEDTQGLVEFGSLVLGVAAMGVIAIWT